MKKRLRDVNAMDREEFTELLGGIFERSPWVAAQVWQRTPFSSLGDLHACMMRVIEYAPQERVTALIRAHPALAGNPAAGSPVLFAVHERKADDSDSLTPEEHDTFLRLNRTYWERFGFPFIFAVRGRDMGDILAVLKSRIGNSPVEERREAVEQIGRIAAYRLADLIADEPRGNIG